MNSRPCVLCIGGHDPTGGAGLQADIETVTALGARACTLVTCLTAQDTHNVRAILSTPGDAFRTQRDTLLGDIQPHAVKIGVLGSTAVAGAVIEWLDGFDGPVVFDPVIAAGGGTRLASAAMTRLLREAMVPRATLITPNRAELRQLADCADEAVAITRLLATRRPAVLVTGADEAADDQVTNALYRRDFATTYWHWPLLPNRFHGSGCTLASACAARLAFGDDVEAAAATAQSFTWQSLAVAEPVGSGQQLPVRLR